MQLPCGVLSFSLSSSLVKDRFFFFFGHSSSWSITQLKTACAAAGGHTGEINPKIYWKYIWSCNRAITNLVPYVVSHESIIFHFYADPFLLKIFQISLWNRNKNDHYNQCLLSFDRMDFKPQRKARKGTCLNSKSQLSWMRCLAHFRRGVLVDQWALWTRSL